MAKRKLSNVMEVSSEESDGEATKLNVPAPKRPKTPFIPPRISAELSQPREVPQNVVSSASRPKTLAASHSKVPALGAANFGFRLPTPHATPPMAGNTSVLEDDTSNSDVLQTPNADVSSKVATRVGMGPGPALQRSHQLAIGSKAPAARPSLALEKAVNQLANTIEANQKLNDEWHQENERRHRQYEEQNEKNQKILEQILGAVTQKQEASAVDPVGRAETPSTPTTTTGAGQFVPANPPVTRELAELAESVVAEAHTYEPQPRKWPFPTR